MRHVTVNRNSAENKASLLKQKFLGESMLNYVQFNSNPLLHKGAGLHIYANYTNYTQWYNLHTV